MTNGVQPIGEPQLPVVNQGWSTSLKLFCAICLIAVILGAMVLPNFVGARKKAKVSHLKSNLHTMKLAMESYAADCAGVYPKHLKDFAAYFPGGANTPGGSAGTFAASPFTGSCDAAVIEVSYATLKNRGTMGNPGQMLFAFDEKTGKTYVWALNESGTSTEIIPLNHCP